MLPLDNDKTQIMEQIKMAMLTGQSKTMVMGIEIVLPKLPRDTQAVKERFAEKKAKELYKLITD